MTKHASIGYSVAQEIMVQQILWNYVEKSNICLRYERLKLPSNQLFIYIIYF